MANVIPIYKTLAQNTDYIQAIARVKDASEVLSEYRDNQHVVGAYRDADTQKMHGDRASVTLVERLTQPTNAFGSSGKALIGMNAPILTESPYFAYARIRAVVSESAKGESNLEIKVTVYLNKAGRDLTASAQETAKASITSDIFKAMAEVNTLLNDQGYVCGLTHLCATALGIVKSDVNSTFANAVVKDCARNLLGYYGMNVADVQLGLTAVIPVAN